MSELHRNANVDVPSACVTANIFSWILKYLQGHLHFIQKNWDEHVKLLNIRLLIEYGAKIMAVDL